VSALDIGAGFHWYLGPATAFQVGCVSREDLVKGIRALVVVAAV